MHTQPLLLARILWNRPTQTLRKGRTMIVLMQMDQFMLNQVVDPFGWQQNDAPMKKELSFFGA